MTKLLQQCSLFFIVVVIPGHNLGNSHVSVNRTIGPTLVLVFIYVIFFIKMIRIYSQGIVSANGQKRRKSSVHLDVVYDFQMVLSAFINQ